MYEGSNVERFRRIHQNHIENYIPFLIAAYIFIANRNSVSDEIAGCVIFTIFTLARFFFTVFYGLSLQPWRSIAYMIGNAMTMLLLVWAGVTVWISQ